MRHIAIIDPGTRVPELDSFNRMALHSPAPLTYHLPAQHGVDSLHRASDGLLGVVILGSGASVHDDLDWQRALDDWLLPRLEAGTPALGLCYGHQHLAHRLGGDVGFVSPDQEKLKGLRRVRLNADPLWGEGCAGDVVVSHNEMVTHLPPGFVARGATERVPVEAMAHLSRPIWGFQSHPEATTAFTTNNSIPFTADPACLAFGHRLVDAFLRFAAHRQGSV